MTRENEAEVLAYCNSLRAKYGIGEPLTEMPPDLTIEQWRKDGKNVTQHCPVSVALERPCGGSMAAYLPGVRFPEVVRQFIVDHDKRFGELLNALG